MNARRTASVEMPLLPISDWVRRIFPILAFASLGTQPLFALQVPTEPCQIEVRMGPTLGALDDSASLSDPARFDVSPAPAGGGWVVGDPDQEYVLSYDAEGRFLGRFLPSGEGPGELRIPARTVLDASDSLWVSRGVGRAVVVGADGGGRTIVSSEQYGVDGHTPSGLPFGTRLWLELDDQGEVIPGSTALGAIVMDREGNALWTLGPVRQGSSTGAMPSQTLMQPLGLAAMADSVLWGNAHRADDPGAWVARWTVEGAEPLLHGEDIASMLGEQTEDLRSPFGGGLVGLAPDGAGGAWGLARSPVLSEEEEEIVRQKYIESLADEGGAPPGFIYEPGVANRAYSTVLFHLSSDADLTGATLLDGMARGFAGRGSYYTLEETAEGLLQVQVWEFSQSCSQG